MIESLVLGGGVSILCGLDRTAFLQLMLSRPVVAAPLAGMAFGSPETGLLIGALLELIWLGRLPMGAAIPPDDTQVAVGGTFLATVVAGQLAESGLEMSLLALLIALPLGKVGAFCDHWARKANSSLCNKALDSVQAGDLRRLEWLHLRGLFHFALSSLTTFLVIVGGGWILMRLLVPFLNQPLNGVQHWIFILFPLVGIAHMLANLNVNRAISLFGSSFLMTYLLLWLM